MKNFILLLVILIVTKDFYAQSALEDSCKLKFGTNLAGISDWGTEMPFIDMMRYAREWYTKDVDNPNAPFNSEHANSLSYRADGYPTHLPQTIPTSPYKQVVATIWGATDGWESGNYILLIDGAGKINLSGNISNVNHINNNKYTFTMTNPANGIVELRIDSSSISDPIRNIRIIKDSYENIYQTQIFNPVWLEKLSIFNTVRFMDWGRTNNWSQPNEWTWQDTTLLDWNERAKYDYYTWTTNKGVPYEVMIKLMNEYNIDGWVCVPHKASNDYITKMAQFFRTELDTNVNLHVEFSNEIWNWMFGQTQWLNQYGCINQSISWPEGIVPYVQNCMDIWSLEWQTDLHKLNRVVGVQGGWLDVSQRIVFNLDTASFDCVAPTSYFGLSDAADSVFDILGNATTVQDIATSVRNSWNNDKQYLLNIKQYITDSINKQLAFYEGGQHLTSHPFGVMPSYANALIAIQRDSSMYNLYNEWFDFLRTLQNGAKPLLTMNFSFISSLNAQYGSWGILETQYQDTSLIPAPKYSAILANIYDGCLQETPIDTTSVKAIYMHEAFSLHPNPSIDKINISSKQSIGIIKIYDASGRLMANYPIDKQLDITLDIANFIPGMYILEVNFSNGTLNRKKMIKL